MSPRALLGLLLFVGCASAPPEAPASRAAEGVTPASVEDAYSGERVLEVVSSPDRKRALVFVGPPDVDPAWGRVAAHRVELFTFETGERRLLAEVEAGTPGPWANVGWSPEGRYLAMLESRWGPVQIYRSGELGAPAHAVDGAGEGPARVHRLVGWVAPGLLELTASCCGTTERFRLDARTGELVRISASRAEEGAPPSAGSTPGGGR